MKKDKKMPKDPAKKCAKRAAKAERKVTKAEGKVQKAEAKLEDRKAKLAKAKQRHEDALAEVAKMAAPPTPAAVSTE